MKVQLLADVSDHRRSYVIGEVCDVPDDQALRWVEAGFVRVVRDEPEAATLEPEENAEMPRGRKRP